MIRDSVIYVDLENIISVEENNQYYIPKVSEQIPENFKVKSDTVSVSVGNDAVSVSMGNDAVSVGNDAVSVGNDAVSAGNDVVSVSIGNDAVSGGNDKNAREPFSLVYVRPTHADNQNYIKYLQQFEFCKENEILYEGYDNIFKTTEKKYNISLHYLNYDPRYMMHMEKVMKNPLKHISFICDPLYRVVDHYNFSNSFKTIYSFNEFYLNFGNKYNVGWTGKRDVTNNYFATYLGFRTVEEITEEALQDRYSFIFVAEKPEASFKQLNKLLGCEKEEDTAISFNTEVNEVNEYIKNMFRKNNALDYKLYDICCKLVEEPEAEGEQEPEEYANWDAEKPDAEAENPKTEAENPKTEAEKQDAEAEKPETEAEKPEEQA